MVNPCIELTHGNLICVDLNRTCDGVGQRRYLMDTQKLKRHGRAVFLGRGAVNNVEHPTMQFQTCRFGVCSMGNGESWYEIWKS